MRQWLEENFGALWHRPRLYHEPWFGAYERMRTRYEKLTQDIAERKLERIECEDGTYLVKYEKVDGALEG